MKHFFHIATLVVLISSIVFIYPTTTQAEGNPIGYDKVCLKAEKVIEKNGEKTIRKRKLTGTGLPVGKTIYIVSITQSKSGQIITTGDQAADTELAPFGDDFAVGLAEFVEFEFDELVALHAEGGVLVGFFDEGGLEGFGTV